MRKVIGLGETVLDITFKDGQPISSRPGGSVFNTLISLGRLGLETQFISEVAKDRLGRTIQEFLDANHVGHDYVYGFDGGKTPLALAFLDEKMNADYVFYKDYPKQRLDYVMPRIEKDDIVILGSFFAINPVIHEKVADLLEEAKAKKAIVYYDVNFRKTHKEEVRFLMPNILDDFEYATIVKGSDEDFENIYSEKDSDHIYKEYVEFYSKTFLYTRGAEGARVYGAGKFKKEYAGKKIDVVSSVGAGDNFNAGIIYGLIKQGIGYDDLKEGVSEEKWDNVMKSAIDFSAQVCQSLDNYIGEEYAKEYGK